MVRSNDYRRYLFNGDTGSVVSMADGSVKVVFEGDKGGRNTPCQEAIGHYGAAKQSIAAMIIRCG